VVRRVAAAAQRGGAPDGASEERLSGVEYLYYVLVVLVILAVLLAIARIPGQARLTRNHEQLAERARSRRDAEQQKPAEPDRRSIVLRRQLRNVPTPWGWPGSDLHHEDADSEGSLGRWVDRLISEKRTVQDEAYRLRKESSMRALLEDRYGRPVQATEVPYRKVAPPKLRDPDLPHDQMDNFPSGRGERIMSQLQKQPRTIAPAKLRPSDLKDVKRPWGW
jgi:hypothetical protein